MTTGDDVTLPCRATGGSLHALEWTRPDLVYPEYILLFRDGRPDPTHQKSSYKNRLDLTNIKLQDGEVSLTLKNVSDSDSGTYECRVVGEQSRSRQKRAVIKKKPISIIRLEVRGEFGLHHVLSVCPTALYTVTT